MLKNRGQLKGNKIESAPSKLVKYSLLENYYGGGGATSNLRRIDY
ncbi:MAG: hypothetical protein ACXW1N_08240 [Halobacteriota archaeon]